MHLPEIVTNFSLNRFHPSYIEKYLVMFSFHDYVTASIMYNYCTKKSFLLQADIEINHSDNIRLHIMLRGIIAMSYALINFYLLKIFQAKRVKRIIVILRLHAEIRDYI